MEFMKKAGESMAKRPAVPLLILILITAASLGVIAINPPSFDMDEGSFMPDDEMTRASKTITDAFTSSVSVMSMVDARGTAAGDVFTTDVFLDVLKYQKELHDMTYEDENGVSHNYTGLKDFRVISPVSVIAGVLFSGNPQENNYAGMIATIEAMAGNDAVLKAAIAGIMTDPTLGMMLEQMTTNDYDPVAVSASGCMVSISFADDGSFTAPNGELDFENEVITLTKDLTPLSGVSIKAAGMSTMMNEIGTLVQKDISMLLPIAIVVIVVLLFLIYRDISDTLIGLGGLLIAIVWTFGISTAIGVQMSTIAIAVPILIMALGIDYSLHMVFRYREERAGGNDRKTAISNTMGSVGEALVLATVTT
ncbi:MAG: MMPL family transporter, partial [Methanomassiliicoccaceae archaeon]|nr:MMPL family transporter [Methanomassiliicoccaceae archaeon]